MSVMRGIMRSGPRGSFDAQVRERKAAAVLRALIFWGLAALAALLLPQWQRWQLLEEQARDAVMARAVVRAGPPHAQIVLVDLSEDALAALGGWPLSRNVVADLVEELLGPLAARAVGLDMVFPEPGDPLGDARLASLAQNAPLVLAQALDLDVQAYPTQVGELVARPMATQALAAHWAAVPSGGYVANHMGLRQAHCVGHIAVRPDGDGVLRRLAPLVRTARGDVPMLAAALALCGGGGGSGESVGGGAAHGAAADGSARVGAPRAQDAPGGARRASFWRLPYALPYERFDTVDAAQVLAGAVARERVAGRYVLVGSSALGLSDYVATPLQARTPGVLVHAQALAEWLDHGMPRPDRRGALWSAGAVAVACALLWWAWRRNQWWAWGGWVLGCALWWAALVPLFAARVFALALLPPAVGGLALAGATLWQFKLVRDTKRRALETLGHYVARPVLDELFANGLERNLQPRLCEITVLVVDMQGYTRLTHELALQEAAALTQGFLELITQPVVEHRGTLDRYTGDGLIAFWGAPLADARHADAALACVQALRARLAAWNHSRAAAGLAPCAMRMGVESGWALVGDWGSSVRSVYTAVGTCINTASRLQELARDLHADLAIGPQTARLAHTPLQPLAEVQIRGLPGMTVVYTLDAAHSVETVAVESTGRDDGDFAR